MTPSLPKHIHENLNMALVSSKAVLPRATGHAHTDRDLIFLHGPCTWRHQHFASKQGKRENSTITTLYLF